MIAEMLYTPTPNHFCTLRCFIYLHVLISAAIIMKNMAPKIATYNITFEVGCKTPILIVKAVVEFILIQPSYVFPDLARDANTAPPGTG